MGRLELNGLFAMASNAIKRQRKRRRVDTDGDPEFQVAPMVDVLLVLTLFFMSITSTELLKKEKNLQLAEAKHAKKENTHEPGKITVNGGTGSGATINLVAGGELISEGILVDPTTVKCVYKPP